jgi:hypothetical protein
VRMAGGPPVPTSLSLTALALSVRKSSPRHFLALERVRHKQGRRVKLCGKIQAGCVVMWS